jgi:AbiEi antitoxin C-terminal domain/Protein of unknown function (DUF559)
MPTREIRGPSVPFTRTQAHSDDISSHDIQAALTNREIVRLLVGVYLVTGIPVDALIRAQAASLVITEHSVLCDRTAAWLHGIDVMRYGELDVVPPLETSVLRGHARVNRPECKRASRDLLPEDWMWLGPVRLTTPVRTALDLCCSLSRRDALAALDAFMGKFGITREELQRLLRRYRRRRGVVQARQIVALGDGRSESPGESWTRLEIIDRGLPAPKPQHWVLVGGVPTYRLDLAYPHARIVVEYDGEAYHTSPEQRAADEARRDWLRRHGWRVIVVTKDSFGDDAARAWTDELRGYLNAV